MWKSVACGMLGATLPLASNVAPLAAQEVEEERIIQVAPDRGPAGGASPPRMEATPRQAPAFWIGVLGGPVSEELRSHLELPADRGILVQEVVDDSPADQAGIKQYDILLRAGGDELKGMEDLVKHVVQAGETEGKIELELIRHGRQETAQIQPEKRPERLAANVGPGAGLRQFNFQMPEGEGPFQFRNFGPDVLLGQPFGAGAGQNLPNGVAITMKREGDKPAEITVKRGDETWTVVADDPQSLEQLPEDLRPLVENMTRGDVMIRREMLPFPGGEGFQPFGGNLQQRLEAMERQMRELEEQFLNRDEN